MQGLCIEPNAKMSQNTSDTHVRFSISGESLPRANTGRGEEANVSGHVRKGSTSDAVFLSPSGQEAQSKGLVTHSASAPNAMNDQSSSGNNSRRHHKRESISTLAGAHAPLTVADFLRKHGGKREITKVLIANNGIAAVKCMRSVRQWCNEVFRNERAVKFVVMVTPDDLAANAEYIKMADQIYPVSGGPSRNNYANVELITDVAIRSQSQAVWAGWGHASENPALPEHLAMHDIHFLGPPPGAMFALGDKIASTIIAQSIGIRTIAWSGDGIKLDLPDCVMQGVIPPGSRFEVPTDLFQDAQVFTLEQALAQARRIGFPVMIKASAGGGGKGIRRAEDDDEDAFGHLFNQVRNEVPGSPIFVMRCAENVRHLEVQVLADQYGEAISVFGRDCTLQRRHQKIIEEAPVTIVQDGALLAEMETKARLLAKLVGYQSAGTVEYLYDLDSNDYYFLELNPRLQVEHPCTEMLTDLNFPACQLQIAMGVPLHRIKQVRALFGEDLNDAAPINFDQPRQPPAPHGHVIAARITCEDPSAGFKPESGALQELNFHATKHAWAYFSVPASGGGLHQFADSQFGHVFASGTNRLEARNNMLVALKELCIRGDFRTTIEFLINVLDSQVFETNVYSTSWLDALISNPQLVHCESIDRKTAIVCCALHLADRSISHLLNDYKAHLERGQVLAADILKTSLELELIYESTKFCLTVVKTGTTANQANQYFLISNQSSLEAEVLRTPDNALLTTFEGCSYTSYFKELPDRYRVSIGHSVCDFSKQSDPTALRVSSSGRLLQFLVQDGQHVQRGQPYAEMEVMKLVQTVHVHEDGVIELLSRAGSILESGAVIARLTLDNPEKARPVDLFSGNLFTNTFGLPSSSPSHVAQDKLNVDSPTASISNRSTPPSPSLSSGAAAGGRRTSRRLSITQSLSSSIGLQYTGDAKVNRAFQRAHQTINNLLHGYCLPEPYFRQQLSETLDALFDCLVDPRLPLSEMQELLAQVSGTGRVPDYLEKQMRAEMQTYAANITSMLCVFPATRLANLIDRCALDSFKKRADREAFYQAMEGIIALIERYKHDVRGHKKHVVEQFLTDYLCVEHEFQAGLFEKCVLMLLEKYTQRSSAVRGPGGATASRERFQALRNGSQSLSIDSVMTPSALAAKLMDASGGQKERELDYIVDMIVSHSKVTQKNQFVMALLDELWARDAYMIQEMRDTIEALTTLSSNDNMKVALKARQMLIAASRPPYELRHNQMESIFLSAVSSFGRESRPQNLRKLIYAEASIFDILGSFFYHSNVEIRKAALEVYVRRSYVAYELYSLQHHLIDPLSQICLVEFRFVLPNSHPNRVVTKRNSSNSLHGLERDAYGYHSAPGIIHRNRRSSGQSASNEEASGIALPRTQSDKNFQNATVTDGQRVMQTQAADSSWPFAPGAWADAAVEQDEDARTICEQLYPYDTQPECHRIGVMAAFNSADQFARYFGDLLELFDVHQPSGAPIAFQDAPFISTNPLEEPVHIINVAVHTDDLRSDDHYVAVFGELVRKYTLDLKAHSIRRVTFLVLANRHFPKFFTFRSRDNFQEDIIYRHLEPALAFQLEINRMGNFQLEPIWTPNHRIYVYMAKSKPPASSGSSSADTKRSLDDTADYRLFARCIIRNAGVLDAEASFETLESEAEKDLLETMDSLEMAFSHPLASRTDCNHIFLNFVPRFTAEPERIQETIRNLVLRYGPRLWKLRVQTAEVRLLIRPTASSRSFAIRLTVTNESGYALDISTYTEHRDAAGQVIFHAYPAETPKPGPLHGLPLATPYLVRDDLQKKRFTAQQLGTTYVYDYPNFFRQVIYATWDEFLQKAGRPFVPSDGPKPARSHSRSQTNADPFAPSASDLRVPSLTEMLQFEELAIDSSGMLQRVTRRAGLNDCGVVAWLMRAYTPEYAAIGREFVVIANDITYQIGSLGPREHAIYHAASQLARQLRVPRIYLACNSGARIGLADEIKSLFRIEWNDPANPERGIRYLYLNEQDYARLGANAAQSVVCERLVDSSSESGEVRYRINAVIGKQDGLGVENLKGSALVAGETARAYNEIVTMGVVTCRTVGIGAYLTRLGRRVIQVENSHIILTGSHALNKVLGKQVYTSNQQLGGIQIMFANGVTYDVVANDRDAVARVMHWLSYVPRARGQPLPVLPVLCDTIEREIEFMPTRSPYDPRWMLGGKYEALDSSITFRSSPVSLLNANQYECRWISGFFDKDSFHELMAGWAPTVIAGRARLGGIPCAVLSVETRQVEVTAPADPANPSNSAQSYTQAGQVWFPDSAFKSSEAIEDFKREDLPLFIFANWRGFSGGMKDMYNEILKFGAMIVESLVGYRQPVLIYIVPNGELRGGAWAVLDPSINPAFMELYADIACRGNVLEPDGTAEIKFRERDLKTLMNRQDPTCANLLKRLKEAAPAASGASGEEQASVKANASRPTGLELAGKDGSQSTDPRAAQSTKPAEKPAVAVTETTGSTKKLEDAGPSHLTSNGAAKTCRSALEAELQQRHEALMHSYHQAALQFIDLHDGYERMKAKGVVTGVVNWRTSRHFFYWRLRRLLSEFQLVFRVETTISSSIAACGAAQCGFVIGRSPLQTDTIQVLQARSLVKQWFFEFHRDSVEKVDSSGPSSVTATNSTVQTVQDKWEDNKYALSWFDSEFAALKTQQSDLGFVARKLREREVAKVGDQMRQLAAYSPDATLDALTQMLKDGEWLDEHVRGERREQCIAVMRELLDAIDKPVSATTRKNTTS